MKMKLVLGLISGGLLGLPLVIAQSGSAQGASSRSSSAFRLAYQASQSQAESSALKAVGGGQVTHVSNDTYQGQAVYDIHVLYHSILYDVKVSKTNDLVMLKKLSSEQPSGNSSTGTRPSTGSGGSDSSSSSVPNVSSSQAGSLAVQAVGGGAVIHVSADHYQGTPVWDVHVSYQNQIWDVKISQATGAVVQKKLSSEQPNRQTPKTQDAKNHEDHHSAPSPSPSGGIPYNQKLTTVPPAYQSYVNQALQQQGGSLKWVKFIHKQQGETQVNIKIRRTHGGTVKVKDLFSASGQLIQQKSNH